MPTTPNPSRVRHLPVKRLEALVDGVFAIAITLLAIEISVPIVHSNQGSDLVDALLEQWPSYAACVLTFFIVGAYWLNHHRMFNLLRGVNHTFMILNVFFLMAIAIIPFPNAVLAEYLTDPGLRWVAAAVYGLAMLVLAVMFNIVWWYAERGMHLFRADCDETAVRAVLKSYLVGPVVFAVGTALSFFVPNLALAIFVVVPLGYLFEGPVAKIDQGYIES